MSHLNKYIYIYIYIYCFVCGYVFVPMSVFAYLCMIKENVKENGVSLFSQMMIPNTVQPFA